MNLEIIKEISQYNIDTPPFSLNNLHTIGKLVNIIDGDSLSIVLPVFKNFYKYNIRINGIDTCEMKSSNVENKRLAIKSRNTILKLVFNDITKDDITKDDITKNDITKDDITKNDITKNDIKEILSNNIILVWVECLNFDKYGRLLANVYTIKNNEKDISLSEYLLMHNLAYKYTGDTKLTENEQLEFLDKKL